MSTVNFARRSRKELQKETKSKITARKDKSEVKHFYDFLTDIEGIRPVIPLWFIPKAQLSNLICEFVSGVSYH